MDDANKRLAEQAKNQQEAAALVDSLDSQVKAELESEAPSNAAVQAGIQSAQDAKVSGNGAAVSGAAANGAAGGSTNGSTSTGTNTGNGGTAAQPAPSRPSTNTGNGGSTQTAPSRPSTNSGGSTGGGTINRPTHVGGSALAVALKYAGTPYVWGGSQPGGFDCSGLVQYAYKQIGISLPRTDSTQLAYVQSHGRFTTNINELQYGDLVFFPGHVAFYVGNGQAYGARRPGVGASTTAMKYLGTFLGGGQI